MTHQAPPDEHAAMPPDESETLIGRIIDHEATPQDLQRFERLAGDDAGLWRRLALEQVDMGLLAGRVRAETAVADGVDAVSPAGGRHLVLAFSGWAAVLVLGVWWALLAGSGDRTIRTTGLRLDHADVTAPQPELSPGEHLDAYLASGFVLGEMDPIVVETEPLDTGGHRVWFVRRIEEFVDIDKPPAEVIGERGEFLVEPEKLRP